MFILAELVLKSYKPTKLEPGMWFVQKFRTGTRWESSEVFAIDSVPRDEQEFINRNGYPVHPYIIEENEDEILAEPEQIGWWDEGDDTDEYRSITINDINLIINEFDGEIVIDGDLYGYDDDECQYPEDKFLANIYAGKVILSYPEYDEYDEDYLTDQDVWENGTIINTTPHLDENGQFLEHWVQLDEEYFIVLTDKDNQPLHPDSEAVIIED